MNQPNWELLSEKLLLPCPVKIWMPVVCNNQMMAGLSLNLAKSQTTYSTFNIKSRSSFLLFHICITDKIPSSNKSQNVKQSCTGNIHSCRYYVLVLKGCRLVFLKDSRKKLFDVEFRHQSKELKRYFFVCQFVQQYRNIFQRGAPRLHQNNLEYQL